MNKSHSLSKSSSDQPKQSGGIEQASKAIGQSERSIVSGWVQRWLRSSTEAGYQGKIGSIKTQKIAFSGDNIRLLLQRSQHSISTASPPSFLARPEAINHFAETITTRYQPFKKGYEKQPLYKASETELLMANNLSLIEDEEAPLPETTSGRMMTFQEMQAKINQTAASKSSPPAQPVSNQPVQSTTEPRRRATFQEMLDRVNRAQTTSTETPSPRPKTSPTTTRQPPTYSRSPVAKEPRQKPIIRGRPISQIVEASSGEKIPKFTDEPTPAHTKVQVENDQTPTKAETELLSVDESLSPVDKPAIQSTKKSSSDLPINQTATDIDPNIDKESLPETTIQKEAASKQVAKIETKPSQETLPETAVPKQLELGQTTDTAPKASEQTLPESAIQEDVTLAQETDDKTRSNQELLKPTVQKKPSLAQVTDDGLETLPTEPKTDHIEPEGPTKADKHLLSSPPQSKDLVLESPNQFVSEDLFSPASPDKKVNELETESTPKKFDEVEMPLVTKKQQHSPKPQKSDDLDKKDTTAAILPEKGLLAQVVSRLDIPITKANKWRPIITAEQATSQLVTQGWRFKRKEGSKTTAPSSVIQTMEQLEQKPGTGKPLATRPRTIMEKSMGRDFGGVRIHTAPLAPLNIQAATKKRDVYVEPGQDSFNTPKSIALLGHELTHVAQQGSASPIAQSAPFLTAQRQTRIGAEEAEADSNEQAILTAFQSSPSTESFMPLSESTLTRKEKTSQPETSSFLLPSAARELPLLPLMHTTALGSSVQRQPLTSDEAEVDPETLVEDFLEEDDELTEPEGPDLNLLARQVYPLIKRRLVAERQQSPW